MAAARQGEKSEMKRSARVLVSFEKKPCEKYRNGTNGEKQPN